MENADFQVKTCARDFKGNMTSRNSYKQWERRKINVIQKRLVEK